MANIIDLRSDTVTQPSTAMRATMAMADVGDDVYGEDPTVNELESVLAQRTAMQAGLFVASGTQGNLLGLLAHCERGDEYIVGQQAHTYMREGGGAAVLGSIQPQPLEFESNGTLDLARVAETIKPDDSHFARTRLLCLENTQDGKVLPLDYIEQAAQCARDHGLGFHLDGARVFNAAVQLGVDVDRITRHFDSVSICLSKGLGAPVGSVLCGSAELIAKARRWRKVVGGGMRQAGLLAAAGLYALEHHVDRLADDHHHAAMLAAKLQGIDGVDIITDAAQTNMVFVSFPPDRFAQLHRYLSEHAIRVSGGNPCRFVTHLDVTKEDIERVIEVVRSFYRGETA